MNKHTKKPPLLVEILPEFAAELQRLLTEAGEPGLAAKVRSLRIFERCDCQADFCASFYVRPRPNGAYGPNHRCLPLFPEAGSLLVLDIVAEEIACVELLDRTEIREKLAAVLP